MTLENAAKGATVKFQSCPNGNPGHPHELGHFDSCAACTRFIRAELARVTQERDEAQRHANNLGDALAKMEERVERAKALAHRNVKAGSTVFVAARNVRVNALELLAILNGEES